MAKAVLIIDDDQKLQDLLARFLNQNGYQARCAKSPQLGIQLLKDSHQDLVILDVMMPEMDGFEACRQIRKFSKVPIVMLTARGDTTDRIVGLEIGADDYLAKPFEPRELLARMHAIFRRLEGKEEDLLVFGDLKVDLYRQEASLGEQNLELSTAEFKVLELLIRSPNRVFSREQIIEGLHGSGWTTFDRSVDVLISRLRTKLGDDAKTPRYLKTIRGSGYRFVGRA